MQLGQNQFHSGLIKLNNISGDNLLSFSGFNLAVQADQTVIHYKLRFSTAADETFKLQYLVELDRFPVN